MGAALGYNSTNDHSPMRRCLIICSLILLGLSVMAQDLQTLSQRDVLGTARYVGMVGAMTAIGGDAAAASDNPAGLGVCRSFEAELTADIQWEGKRVYCTPTIASVAFVMPNHSLGSVVSNNLMFDFHRLKNFARTIQTDSWTNSQDRIKRLDSYESGYMNVYDVAWAINLRHKLYVGASMNFYSWSYAKELNEFVKYPDSGETVSYPSYNTFNGWSVGATVGLIWRPIELLRLGATVSTPSWGKQTITDRHKDLDENDAIYNVVERRQHRLALPLRTSAGLAFQLKQYGLLSLQYDYRGYKGMDGVHIFRLGAEAIAARRWFFNLGYAYETTFKQSEYRLPERSVEWNNYRYTDYFYRSDVDYRYVRNSHTIGAGFGYNGNYCNFRLAYQWRVQHSDLYPDNPWEYIAETREEIYHGDDMRSLRTITNRIVLTIGWKH